MSCDSIVCSIFEVDFETNVIGIKVPSSLLERGIRKGMVMVNFNDVIGPSKTAETILKTDKSNSSASSDIDYRAARNAVDEFLDTTDVQPTIFVFRMWLLSRIKAATGTVLVEKQ